MGYAFISPLDLKLVHVVWDFRPWDAMTKVRYFLMLHFQFSVKVFGKSPDHVQPLESSNYKFEPPKNNLLLSLRPMDENPRRHEQVARLQYLFLSKNV